MTHLRLPLVCSLLLSLVVAGCATTPSGSKGSSRARDYYPLAVGNSWTYRVTPAPADAPLGEVKVVSEENGFYTIDFGGHRGQIGARATSITDGTRTLLEEPLAVGHEWVAVPAPSAVERYRIVATDADVKVPAGMFRGCVQVETEQEVTSREGVKGRLVGVWSYAPGVGPIHFVQKVHVGDAPPRKNVEYTLIRYRVGGEQ